MADEVVFYTNPQSRGRIVHWMLEEVGAPYRTELISFEKNEQKRRRTSRSIRWEKCRRSCIAASSSPRSAAILTYLADAFPRGGTRADAG